MLLREPQIKRLDGEKAGEEESHQLLLRLMVNGDSVLARRHPTEHSAMCEFVFSAPAGYQAIENLEAMRRDGSVLAKLPAEYCRAAFEHVLDFLDERAVELSVRFVPSADNKQAAVVESRHQRVRTIYQRELERSESVTQAIAAAATQSGYSRRRTEEITAEMREKKAG